MKRGQLLVFPNLKASTAPNVGLLNFGVRNGYRCNQATMAVQYSGILRLFIRFLCFLGARFLYALFLS